MKTLWLLGVSINSQGHCILMRLMVGRVKSRLSVLYGSCFRQKLTLMVNLSIFIVYSPGGMILMILQSRIII